MDKFIGQSVFLMMVVVVAAATEMLMD